MSLMCSAACHRPLAQGTWGCGDLELESKPKEVLARVMAKNQALSALPQQLHLGSGRITSTAQLSYLRCCFE